MNHPLLASLVRRLVPLGQRQRSLQAGADLRNLVETIAEAFKPVRSVSDHGMRVLVPASHARRVRRGWEPLSQRWLAEAIRPGAIAVDVGAQFGSITLRLAQAIGSRGVVYAVEPSAENLILLHKNAARSFPTVIVVLPFAAGSDVRTRRLFLADSSDSHSFFMHPLANTTGEIEVRQVRLDGVCQEPDFVKLDVEGAELEVLAGMSGWRDPPSMLVEWSPACQIAAGHDPVELLNYIHARGYHMVVLDEVWGRQLPVEQAIHDLQEGILPAHWYANLGCSNR